jgi:uncharacterized protein with beta-barrel porin domain
MNISLPARANATSFSSNAWRNVLATGVASAALFAYGGRPVRAQTVPPAFPCNTISGTTGTIITCSGDLSSGVNLSNGGGPYSVLNVVNLTTDITPAAGVTGILFTSNGAVEVNVNPGLFAISTTDENGIFASSNGGAVTINSTADIVTTGGSATGLQGSAQNDLLTITSSGNITTSGSNAFGIAAGTVYGDISITSTGNISTSGTFAAGINVGTIGDNGTPLGAVTINASGIITTTGDNSIGINAFSVYGSIDITSTAAIAVSGASSIGINAQTSGDVRISSTGGVTTGPSGGSAISARSQAGSVTISSSGDLATFGANADGIRARNSSGSVDVTSTGTIEVSGANSSGINAQSDGDIRITSSGDIATHGDDTNPAQYTAIGAISALSYLGSVMILSSGDIATDGEESVGIYAAAADGSTMVFSYGNIVTRGDGAAGIAAAGYTGTAVVSTSNIRTYGDSAPGITVMSDGDAAVASSGNITTTGVASDGIAVMSDSGRAAILNSGDISATGMGSAGVYAASYAGTSVINFGAITGCPCGGVVLRSFNGDNNLVNFGSIIADLNGSAIEMDTVSAGANLIENFGTVTGNVLMAGVAGSVFQNNAGALFNPGDTIIGDVSNDGRLAPGGSGTVETTIMAGALVQSGSGIFAVDVAGGSSDQMVVSDNADLAGTVKVNFLSLPALTTYTILQAGSSLTDNGLGLNASPALHAQLQFNGNDLDLVFAIDFTGDGLNPNQRAIAIDLNRIFLAGGGGVTPVLLGLLNTGDLAAYKDALNQLLPEIYSNAEIAALYSSLAFSNSLLSCKVNGAGTAAIIREGQCLWAGASATFLDTGTTFDQIGFTQTAGLFNAGAQVALNDVWRLGFGAGYQSSSLQTATNAQSEGSLAQAGLSVKYNPGPLLLAGTISGGGAWYDTTRTMAFGGFTGVAEGDQDIGIVSGSLRAAYVLGSPHLYFKPILDLGLTHLELGGFTESGGGGAALTVAGGGQTVFTLAPTLEIGSEWWMSNGTLIRPLIRGGAIWYEGADFALTSSFAGAPLGVSAFTINTDIDEVMGLVGAGVEMINGGDTVLRFSYDGQLGETTQIHTVGIKGSTRF